MPAFLRPRFPRLLLFLRRSLLDHQVDYLDAPGALSSAQVLTHVFLTVKAVAAQDISRFLLVIIRLRNVTVVSRHTLLLLIQVSWVVHLTIDPFSLSASFQMVNVVVLLGQCKREVPFNSGLTH